MKTTHGRKGKAGRSPQRSAQAGFPTTNGTPVLNCPLDGAYSQAQWAYFLDCAKRGFATGQRLDKDFYAKLQKHRVRDADVRNAIRPGSCLVAYEHGGAGRLGLFDPRSKLFVMARLPAGEIFNALYVERTYVDRQDNVRWLKP